MENENEVIENPEIQQPEINPEVVVIVPPTPATTAAETSETMNALVSTIAALSDSMTALRLEIQTERQNYSKFLLELIENNFSRVERKLDELKVLEIAEQIKNDDDNGIEKLPEKIEEKIEENVRRRWL